MTIATYSIAKARLIDVLEMELDKHDRQAEVEPNNWGITGNLGKVRSDLIDIVGFLGNMDREDVEKFLSDE